jgi:hypothetical protein
MAELKTKKNEASVENFLKKLEDPQRKADALAMAGMMQKITGWEPKMWGGAIIGFGDLHLKYDSGRELDWFVMGFSPRKQNLALYFNGGLDPLKDELKKLGKYKTGKGCLYISTLTDVDAAVLKMIIQKVKKNKGHSG